VIVNTIFCGPHDQGIATQWKDGAVLADGSYTSIDHNRKAVSIAAPQDKELAELGRELNKTYVPYGVQGEAGRANQVAQDSNSGSVSQANMAQRAGAKASAHYRNGKWDLVDAMDTGKVNLAEVKEVDLPEAMKEMTLQEREAYIKSQAAKRAELKAKIQKLGAERKAYVAGERKRIADSGRNTLDEVIINSVNEQAAAKGFQFSE